MGRAAGTLAHGEKRSSSSASCSPSSRRSSSGRAHRRDVPRGGPTIVALIDRIRERRTEAILLVEHKIDMVMTLSDTIAVLRDGRLLSDDTPQPCPEPRGPGRLLRAGLLRMTSFLELEDVHVYIGQHHILQGISLRVRPDGVTVLLAGTARQDETLRTVMSLLHPRRGSVRSTGIRRTACLRTPSHGSGSVTSRRVRGSSRPSRWTRTCASPGSLTIPPRGSASAESSRCSRISSASGTPGRARSSAGRADAVHRPGPVNPNRLLLIDEPSKGLAPIIVEHLTDALRTMKREVTILLVEQNLALAEAIGDDFILLDDGRTVAAGSWPRSSGTRRSSTGTSGSEPHDGGDEDPAPDPDPHRAPWRRFEHRAADLPDAHRGGSGHGDADLPRCIGPDADLWTDGRAHFAHGRCSWGAFVGFSIAVSLDRHFHWATSGSSAPTC